MWGNLVSLQLYPFAWLAHGAQKGGKKKNTRCPANCGSTREVLTYRYLCNMDLHVSNLMDGCQPWPLQRTQQSCSEG